MFGATAHDERGDQAGRESGCHHGGYPQPCHIGRQSQLWRDMQVATPIPVSTYALKGTERRPACAGLEDCIAPCSSEFRLPSKSLHRSEIWGRKSFCAGAESFRASWGMFMLNLAGATCVLSVLQIDSVAYREDYKPDE